MEQSVATSGGTGYPSLLDLPASTGIRSEPAGQPVIYVIRSGPGRVSRKGRSGPKMAARSADAGGSGPRIVEVSVPRGL